MVDDIAYQLWLASPYGLVHRQAAAHSPSKQTWSLDKIYDADDIIMYRAAQLKAMAYKIFRTLPTNPHTKILNISMVSDTPGMDTPRDAILRIIEDVLEFYGRDLTKRQKEALAAYDEAIQRDIPIPTKYVAERLGIGLRASQKLLVRAKVFVLDDFFHYIYRSAYKLGSWTPSERMVKKLMKSRPRICAHCGGQTYDGSVPLCFSCHSELGTLREEAWPELTRSWLPQEIRRIEKEHRQWAIDACYKNYYGSVSFDELDTEAA